MIPKDVYAAIKIDVVNSRGYKERELLQEKLFSVIKEANKKFKENIVSRFVVTHGDEIQGLLYLNSNIVDIIFFFVEQMEPVKIRIGIGIGTISTKLMPIAIGMDGPAFYAAKDAIDKAHDSVDGVIIKFNLPEQQDLKIGDLFELLSLNINCMLNLLIKLRNSLVSSKTKQTVEEDYCLKEPLTIEKSPDSVAVEKDKMLQVFDSKNILKQNFEELKKMTEKMVSI